MKPRRKNMIFIILIALLFSSCGIVDRSQILFLNPAQGNPEACPSVKVVDSNGERISLREDAGTQFKKITSIRPGQIYKVLAVKSGTAEVKHDSDPSKSSTLWVQVDDNEVQPAQQGWATAVYLECAQEESAPEPRTDFISDSDWVWPVTGERELMHDNWKESLAFGVAGAASGHLGSDFGRGSNLDRPIYAVADGTLVYLHHVAGSNWVDFPVLRHDLNQATFYGDTVVYSRYGHIKVAKGLAVGSTVKRGELIGHIVLNGAFAPHLHFEICNEGCITEKSLTPGAGYGKKSNFAGLNTYDLEGARFYNPKVFLLTGGKS